MRPSAPREAVAEITTARCDREARCGNIGAGSRYSDSEACRARVRMDWTTELSAFECPGGIETDELDECLQAIRTEDCANPFDTLSRVVACRSGDICNSTTIGMTPAPAVPTGAAREAVREIAEARCAREARCGNVGAGHTYADVPECESRVRTAWRTELSAYECRAGVRESELDDCLRQIRDEDCANPFDTLARVVACRSADICG